MKGERPTTWQRSGMPTAAAGSRYRLWVRTLPNMRTVCSTPPGIHIPRCGGTSQVPKAVVTNTAPAAPCRSWLRRCWCGGIVWPSAKSFATAMTGRGSRSKISTLVFRGMAHSRKYGA